MLSFDWVNLLSRLAGHLDKIDDILDLALTLKSADFLSDEWLDAFCGLVKLLAVVFRQPAARMFDSEPHAESEFEAMGLRDKLRGLREFAESPIGQLLLKLLLGTVTG